MSYNPFLPPSGGSFTNPGFIPGGYGVQPTPAAEVHPTVEEMDVDAIDPARFAGIQVSAAIKGAETADTVDLTFHGVPLDDADDFFVYLGTPQGRLDLTVTIVTGLVENGTLHPATGLSILLGL